MRVLIVAPWGEALGGAETMLATILRNAAMEIEVVFLEDGAFADLAREAGVAVHVVPAGRMRHVGRFARSIGSLRRLIEERRPDVVIAWSAKTQLYAAPAVRRARPRPVGVWWQHGVPAGHWLDRVATVLPASAVGCSSRASAEAQRRRRPRREVFVVHPGIEPPAGGGGTTVRSELDIPADAVVVGLVGRLQPWKGQDRFLRALGLLRDEGVTPHALLVGGDAYGLSPEYASHVSGLVSELELQAQVRMTGQVGDVTPYVEAMDVLVNASEEEPFGITLIEGMAAGLTVVAIGRGGPLEIVDDGETGVLLPDGDPATLAAGMRPLIEDPVLRRTLGDASREAFRRRFSAETMVAELERQLAALVAK